MPLIRLRRTLVGLGVACTLTLTLGAQTKIVAPKNNYSLEDDVKLGRDAAAEVAKELPLLNDQRLEDYVETIGRTLAAAIPPEFQHSEFRYTFDMVNQKEINAFALARRTDVPEPGNDRGCQGRRRSRWRDGARAVARRACVTGRLKRPRDRSSRSAPCSARSPGAIVGGTAGSIISQGTQFGLGAAFLKYGREYESQADILGAQILARAGYDPREMANMFKTIEAEGGSADRSG